MKTPKPVSLATDPRTVHKQFMAPPLGQERTRDATHQSTSTQSHRPVEPTASGAWRIGKYCLVASGLAATAGLLITHPELFCIGSAIVLLVVCACGYVTTDRATQDEPQPSAPDSGQFHGAFADTDAELTALVLDTMAEVEQFTYRAKEWGSVPDPLIPADQIRTLAMDVLRILTGTETVLVEWYRREAAVPKARVEQEMAAIGSGLIERVRDAAGQLRRELAIDDIYSAWQLIAKSVGLLESVAKAETLIVRALSYQWAR